MIKSTKKCPFCGEIIDINATVCPICAEDIPIEEISSSKTYCPFCGEEILPTAKKCKHCKNWLINNANGHKYYNNSLITAFGIIGIIILISILFGIISGTGNYYTTDNWLRGCEQGKEYLGDFGIGVYKDYKCKNKSYTDVKEASMTTLGLNSSFEVNENGNPVGYIHYDYNFHQYTCAYVWAQEEVSCNLSEFVSNLRKYEDYKKNKNTKEQKSATKSQDISTKPTPPPIAKPTPATQKPIKSEELSTNDGKKVTNPFRYPVASKEKTDINAKDLQPYMQEVIERTNANWEPPKTPYSVEVIVAFKISKDGRLLSSQIKKSSGISEVDASALRAVEITAPFRPLPYDYNGQSIDIQMTLSQNAYRNGEKVLPPEY